ncbi:biliverdin-producing heme oxygenase [[Pseudomonas] boreopolis]|uniref:Heme oxygenase n=1 Tax=Xanthomonas boreopolis TaxID=86183 RepID=A0A919F5X5_9XANT|nr:heme oxygenase [[Pseudomonas] boreopolis]
MNEILIESTRSQRLKAATHEAHDRLDKRIMAARPFASREHYGRFLQVQYRFHCDMEGYFLSPVLGSLIPGLPERRRLSLIHADLADLGVPLPEWDVANGQYGRQVSGLGWLYVAEGSSLGAAILLKHAARLGLGEDFGARHLAGHPDGRARHWREFTAVLDRVALTPDQEQAVIESACQAFDRVRSHVERYMPVVGE